MDYQRWLWLFGNGEGLKLNLVKTSLSVILVVILVGTGWTCYQWGLRVGTSEERAVHKQAIEKWRRKTQDALVELEDERQERRQVQKKIVEKIRYVEDPTGCIDERVPTGILHQDSPGSGGPVSDGDVSGS